MTLRTKGKDTREVRLEAMRKVHVFIYGTHQELGQGSVGGRVPRTQTSSGKAEERGWGSAEARRGSLRESDGFKAAAWEDAWECVS